MKQLILATSLFFVLTNAFSADDHDHEKEKNHKEESEHKHEDKHEDEHAVHTEENSQVGPNKGITEANAENGIKLSAEAEKNFEIEKLVVNKTGKIAVHINAVVTAGEEVNVFRYRNGFYKRIDFIKIAQTRQQITLLSKDLIFGDFVVIKGLGFLRIAEIAAFGGAPEGHSH